MPETDVTKMKVADLKRELKVRGLITTGNKTELQDRLQTALIDGELSLEDTAITADDLLDEDAVLTDEDEAKILGDENELLKSPINTPAMSSLDLSSPALALQTDASDATEHATLESPTTVSKKIVLKRKNSFTATEQLTKENTEPVPSKVAKTGERKLITMGSSSKIEVNKNDSENSVTGATTKVTQLSLQERLELRAKKFGINALAGDTGGSTNVGGSTSAGDKQKEIEMLKKRAERFGCVVSSKIAKIDADEKLKKRQERFGTSGGGGTDAWAEKARMRLERFKTTTSASTATDSTTTAAAAITTIDN